MKRILHIVIAAATAGIFLTSCSTERVYAQGNYGSYPNASYDNGYYGNNNYDNGYYDNGYDNYDQGNISFDVFYNELRPYGSWKNHSRYGRVWIPRERNFRPYATNGYWVNTNVGWNWVSNYSWGWAPFHYGRWDYDNMFGGWYWVPDYTWGPAWVNWGSGPDYYGWAPMTPGMSVGVSIGNIATFYWNFLPSRYMGHRNMHDYYLPYSRNNYYVRNTTIINNYNYYSNSRSNRYYSGPSVSDVRRRTGSDIRTYNVSHTNSRSYNGRINDNNLSVYTGGNSRNSRSYTPSRSNDNAIGNRSGSAPSRSYTPSRSNSSNEINRSGSAPSRSYTPERSSDNNDAVNRSSGNAPSRSYSPDRSRDNNNAIDRAGSAPSRSYTPNRSNTGNEGFNRSGAPTRSNTPERSAAPAARSRSYNAPAQSQPSVSSRSEAPQRSYTPQRSASAESSRSSSAPSRSYSAPSRGSGSSSGNSAPSRSYTPRR